MVREAPRTGSRSRRITALCPLQISPWLPLRASIMVRGSSVRGGPGLRLFGMGPCPQYYPQQTCPLG